VAPPTIRSTPEAGLSRASGRKARPAGAGAAGLAVAVAAALAVAVVAVTALAPRAVRAQGDETSDAVEMHLGALEYALGRADAPLTVVEFTDYQCPYCRRFEAETWPRLKHDWVDTGKVRFIVRDLPLEIHSAARPAAEAAHCAGEQGRFWRMHDLLLGVHADLSPQGIDGLARSAGVDLSRLHACLAAHKYSADIARNIAEADRLQLNGTPSFVVGRVVGGVLTGERVSGALPYEDFNAGLTALLQGG
jgi:protein-disulfide isomerase